MPVNHAPVLLVVIAFLNSLFAFTLNKIGRSKLAILFFIIPLWIITFLSGFYAAEAQILSTSGYIILTLSAMVMIPGRFWVFVFSISFIVTIFGFYTLISPPLATTEPQITIPPSGAAIIILIQLFYLLGSVIVIYMAWSNFDSIINKVKDNNSSLSQQAVQLELANSTLQAAEARYRVLVENASEAILVVSSEDWQIVDANLEAICLFGYTKDQFQQLTTWGISLGSQPEALAEGLQSKHFEQLRNGQQISLEWWHKKSNGQAFLSEMRLVALPETNPQLIRACIIDLTERKKTEQMLRQAQKLESLGILAGGIAHDFNNLLVAILGQNSVALAKLESDHQARKHLHKAIDASNKAADLTKQMLAYSGKGSFTIQAVQINKLIQENLSLLTLTMEDPIDLKTNLTSNLPLIKADITQLQQLIFNLLMNASQAMNESSGRIEITTGLLTVEADDTQFWRYTSQPLDAGAYVSIKIKDNGIGMDQRMIEKIFDPFFTTKQNGTGLGLAAVLGILRGHHAGIQVISTIGLGTTFQLVFPVWANGTGVEENTIQAAILPAIFQETVQILVIDDEPAVAEAASDMLMEANIQTVVAYDGQQGVEIYKEKQTEIDLVLVDLMMPKMNGVQVYKALKVLNPDVEIVLTSGYSRDEAMKHFVEREEVGFIQKPYTIEVFIKKIIDYLGQY